MVVEVSTIRRESNTSALITSRNLARIVYGTLRLRDYQHGYLPYPPLIRRVHEDCLLAFALM